MSQSPMTTPSPKKSFRARVGTVMRRSSSFLVPSRPGTPSARSDSDDLMGSVAGSPPRTSTLSSKPASIRSMERIPTVPLVAPEDAIPAERRSEEPKQEPEVNTEAPAPPAPDVPAPAALEAAAPEPAALEPAASEPVSEPQVVAAVADVSPPKQPEPVQVPEPAPEVEKREERQPEPKRPAEPARAPVSESPRSLSRASSRDGHARSDAWSSSERLPAPAAESPKALPKQLSLKTSRENMLQELSPIAEDERSALEERAVQFGVSGAVQPSTFMHVAPVMATGFSRASDSGTTPRAATRAISPERTEYQPYTAEKGKEREQNGSADPLQRPRDGYFPSIAPMPVPRPAPNYILEDPFRDPDPSTTSYDGMPEPVTRIPEPFEQRAAVQPSFPMPSTEPVSLPLPPLDEVTSRNLRSVPSDYTLAAHSSRAPSVSHGVETDETLPLLSHPKNGTLDSVNPTWPSSQTFRTYGWEAYTLPDSTTYYSHPRKHITTDIDLQNSRKLSALIGYLDKKVANETYVLPEGGEIWLHEQGVTRDPDDFVLVRCWVNHGARALGYWPPPADRASERTSKVAEDRLDLEYRYWAFMESHPAHVPLPVNAYAEALDALTWAYTDRLLKTNRRAPPPFTQHESQELIGVLRLTSGTESPAQAAIQTKIASRILRRLVQWKQHFFRPEKPLPRGVTAESPIRKERGTPYRRTFSDFVVAWLCFGIPYLYANRQEYQLHDEESRLMRSTGPVLIVGASVSIVAAIILTASVTFLALPGQDQVARSAGFVAVLGSLASLGSSVIAAFRNQVETQRMAARGGEGFVVMPTLSGYSILPSLPAVFLAWSIISFVTGIVLYAFRGTVMIDPSHWVKFSSYTRWTTVGACGFLGGVLIASMFFIRH
ncbi:hypothetical protein EW145_g1540 [Phellinidium pouzarii]|uniref:Uncharacterized protein n=1 Tax=Phellinidium pouzarii TaxID=167371 RepID=A0A4S4LEM9_9AGAM|nr:hypothetical protein EW145_g1540 [Phellinidium pouzarii]